MKHRFFKPLALCLALLFVALLSVSCARSAGYSSGDAYGSPMESPNYNEEAAFDANYSKTWESPAEGEPLSEKESAPESDRKRIYTATLTLETRTFDEALSRILSDAEKAGGYAGKTNVWQRTASGDRIYHTAEITVRIPADRFESYLNTLGGYCNVTSSSTNVSDVTEAYQDLAARLSSYKTQEQRLLAMLEKADDLAYLLQLEDKLSEVRYHIESYEARLRNIDQQVSYSTVTMTLTEVVDYTVPAPETFGSRMAEAFSGGWNSFVTGAADFAVAITWILPLIVLIALIVIVIVLIVKAKKKKRISRAAQYAQQPVPPQQPPVHLQPPPQYRQPPQK
ncbi:MAG: DUF4349 domain-containing protein [Clostridia bacterium]|nr:DUF4349 domain-containing protein [Clostridia bacterium]